MDERAQLLLKTLVERYIADGQPIGSRTLSRADGIDWSPATIRNVLQDLEELGLIASPHTSAGRVPTPRGYRLFVDTMLTSDAPLASTLAPELSHTVHVQQLSLTAPNPDDRPQTLVSHAAQLLSQLSHFVGVVTTPKRSPVCHHLEFLRLSAHRVLLILVSPDGEVQNRVLHTQADYSQDQLQEASQFFSQRYAGSNFDDIRHRMQAELSGLQKEIADLMHSAVQAGQDCAPAPESLVVLSGERNLLSVSDFAQNLQRLRSAFDLFEQKAWLLQLLEESASATGIHIYIGGDSQAIPSDMLSMVSAPYSANGNIVGTLAVIGPTRMPYRHMVQIVDITSRLLSNALNHSARA